MTFSKKPTFPAGAVLSQTEADERYALKGEGGGDSSGGNDCGLTPEEVEKLSIYANAEGRSITPALNLATEVGHTYTVTAKGSNIDVTASNGTPLCSVPAGSQLSFVAIGTTTKLSSTDCSITENFKGAAHVVLSGGGTSEGGGEPEGDYLLFNADRSIRGGRLDKVKNINYLQQDVRNWTDWDIPLPSVTTANSAFRNCTHFKNMNVALPELTTANSMCYYCESMRYYYVDMPKLYDGNSMFCRSALIEIRSNLSALYYGELFCGHCQNLVNFDCELPSLFNAPNMFAECKLNKESVLRICNSIPTWSSGTHKITLGIHVDHKYDPEVNAALKRLDANYEPLNLSIDETTGDYIAITESKGWTIVVQWTGTATENAYPNPAATYSLRPQVAPIYAKLGEDFDGKSFIDWGHYVTDWEENGYMEFASLEEAREYFNITE